ncbi:MAG: MFS transporter [Bacteroidota bacterium]|nr:MFS transporter [Bacteroidota bacterium]
MSSRTYPIHHPEKRQGTDTDPDRHRRNKRALAIVFLIIFIDLLGFGIVIPILPLYAKRGFGMPDALIGVLVSSFPLMQLVFTPFWGKWSDRIGRKPVLSIGLLFTMTGYVLFGLASSVPVLFLSRMLAGIGGSNIGAAQAFIADSTGGHERAKGMGLVGTAFGLGFVFGPVIGGLLSRYGYAVPGFSAACLSFLALLLTLGLLPQHQRHATHEPHAFALSPRALRRTVSRLGVRRHMLLFFLVTFAYANTHGTLPLLAARVFGYADYQVGYLFGFMGIISAATQGVALRFLLRTTRERSLFLVGSILTMIGLISIPLCAGTITLYAALGILAFGSSLLPPTLIAFVSRLAEPAKQGETLGVNESLGALGRTLGPAWGAFVFQTFGPPAPFFTGGAIMGAALFYAWKSVGKDS